MKNLAMKINKNQKNKSYMESGNIIKSTQQLQKITLHRLLNSKI